MTAVRGPWRHLATGMVLVALLACTGEGGEPDPGGIGGSEAPATEGPSVSVTDPDDRVELERRLGHHTMLLVDAMRATADDSPRAPEVRRALERNTDELVAAMATTVGATSFDRVWVPRIDALLVLAGGGDADLDAAHAEYGAFVADTLDGAVSADDAAAQLAVLDDELREQIDHYRDGDLAAAHVAQREAFSTAFRLAQQLVVAAGAAPEVTSGATELRSAMHQLLGEHTWLAVTTARRNARGARDARHPSAALNGNTEDLTAALLSIYGEQAAVAFDEQWREAIAALMRFTAAETELDDDARRTAARDLRRATRSLAEQLATMTESTISEQEARQELTRHFRLLRRHGAAVADGRFRRAYDVADDAYAGSATLADLIATGIAEHRADEFPQE